ncbi:MAG TPA: Na+/H+ antiporter subunit E [Burkholderiales bacterium]|nr:Na+/H+ antiporter subunit E [Burkholderiales bacterium]
MSRWLPYPLLSLSLLAMWLLLNRTLAPGQVLLGALLALGGALALAKLQAPEGRVRRGVAIVEMVWLVLVDVVRSNLAVARLVLYRRTSKRVAGFVYMPLAVRHPGAMAVLACILTATPGTSWARLDAAHHILVIHVFDLIDEQAWLQRFKERYERRLMEIFE